MMQKSGVEERAIEEFLKSIKSGPFKCLNPEIDPCSYSEVKDSQRVVECGKELAFPTDKKEKDVFDCAVYQAYLDMCRTAHGVEEKAKDERDLIAKEIHDFFDQTDAECSHHRKGDPDSLSDDRFDSWHKCVIETATGRKNKLTIGQIQKIVNMAFKYLYCCKDIREEKPDLFANCHMALDAYTLAWLKRVDEDCYKAIQKDSSGGRSWSKIDEMEIYQKIVTSTRNLCKVEKWPNQSCPFLAEFFIWPHEMGIAFIRETTKNSKRLSIPRELMQEHGDSVALLNCLCEKREKLEELAEAMENLSKGGA